MRWAIMTYKELYQKCFELFDPEKKGMIKGYPVMVLYTTSKIADAEGWDEQVVAETFRERISEKTSLNKDCVAAVLGLL